MNTYPIPAGWRMKVKGLVAAGDQYWSPSCQRFKIIPMDDVGNFALNYYCVIEMIPAADDTTVEAPQKVYVILGKERNPSGQLAPSNCFSTMDKALDKLMSRVNGKLTDEEYAAIRKMYREYVTELVIE